MASDHLHLGRPSTDPVIDGLGHWAAALADVVGFGVLQELTSFSQVAEPGAMITIRCTRDGFTAQVTGPIVSGRLRPPTSEAITEMTEQMKWRRSTRE